MASTSLIFGGATIGDKFRTAEEVDTLLNQLSLLGIHRIDTAAKYPPKEPGLSEKLLGELKAAERGFFIDTKISCNADGKGSLTANAIEASLSQSLKSLGVAKINVLYCHRTDPETPLETTAAALNEQYLKGKFNKLGVANFSASALGEFLSICSERNFVRPTVYQGQYNVIYREHEETIFPLLRQADMSYVAYSVMAGSILAKPSSSNQRVGTGLLYASNEHVLSAIGRLSAALGGTSANSLTGTALRWISWDSQLRPGTEDSIILGASKIEQVQDNTARIAEGSLQRQEKDAVESLWSEVKSSIFEARANGTDLPAGTKNISLQVWRENTER